uniref:Uncharacterized protein n=1 Tax=Colobus angolensis palliatus TaxID=336983 RepID=A0A2K5HU45_COLAP
MFIRFIFCLYIFPTFPIALLTYSIVEKDITIVLYIFKVMLQGLESFGVWFSYRILFKKKKKGQLELPYLFLKSMLTSW